MKHGNTGKIPWNKGKQNPYSEATLQKMREAKKNYEPWNKGKAYPAAGPRLAALNRLKVGELNPNWKGGITSETRLFRASRTYKAWRMLVLERDNFACVECSSTEQLEVDHIKPFRDYPELRLALENGRTLCHSCHERTPTYGGKMLCA